MALSYQWQKSDDGSTGWSDLPGETGNELSVVTNDSTDLFYRVGVTSSISGLTTYSAAAKLNQLANTPSVVTHPSNVIGNIGEDVEFVIQTSVPYGSVSYQWQWKEAGSGSWQDSTLATANNSVLRVAMSADSDGREYRCKVTATAGGAVVYSNAAVLSTYEPPVINTQPSNVSGYPTQTVTFSVAASDPEA